MISRALILIVNTIFLFTGTFVYSSSSIITKNNVSFRNICSKELESIVYIPPTPDYEYLKKISREFKIIISPFLWSDPLHAQVLIRRFRIEYPDIRVSFLNAVGQIVPNPGGPGINVRRRDHSVYQAYGIGQGYQKEIFHRILTAMLADIYWNPTNDGQMYTVLFDYPLTNFYV